LKCEAQDETPIDMAPAKSPWSGAISRGADDETPETRPLLETDDDSDDHLQDDVSVRRSMQWERQAEPSLATVQPQAFTGMTDIRRVFFRTIKTSYFALYQPLDDLGSRCLLLFGVLLAIGAGLPLPIIGVILGRIINNFPPPQDELVSLLYRLMSVAVCYFAVTWGWAVCWAVIGEKVSRRTRERLLKRALGMDMTYFDTDAPEMSSILTEKMRTIQMGTSEKVGLFIASISYFVSAFAVGFMLNARLTGVM
jgi:ATP-binding cassette subfamily B (MDR/TAP) protein 1